MARLLPRDYLAKPNCVILWEQKGSYFRANFTEENVTLKYVK
jgi:hypothetical protein